MVLIRPSTDAVSTKTTPKQCKLYVGHYEFNGSIAVKHTAYDGTFVVDAYAQSNLKGTIALDGETENINQSSPINGFGRGFFNVKIGDTENIGAFALIPHKK